MNRREFLGLAVAAPAVAPAVIACLGTASELPAACLPTAAWWDTGAIGPVQPMTVAKLNEIYNRMRSDIDFVRHYSLSAKDIARQRAKGGIV